MSKRSGHEGHVEGVMQSVELVLFEVILNDYLLNTKIKVADIQDQV